MSFLLLFLLALAGLSVFGGSSAAQQVPEEEVIVTANTYPVPFGNLSRSVAVFTREDIEQSAARSITDILSLASSIDLSSRSPFGIQSDISIRGSAFSQTLILVDGVRINDSQTAHHNSDFPVQLQDVERIEVLLGPGSSIYGADAFGGAVNIITRRSVEGVRASFTGGQHGLLQASFSTGMRKGAIEQSISATGARSSGFQYDRDFRSIWLSGRTGIGENSSIFYSHLDKEFGANGFYGPSPSREWTTQTFIALEHTLNLKSGGKASFSGYYRTHGDRFLYDIRTPGLFESSHRTHSAGFSARTQHALWTAGALTLGGEGGAERISSNKLGNHAFARTSAFTELQWSISRTAVLYPGLRFDYYSNFGSSLSPSLSASWWVQPRIRLRFSAGRAFRIPSFTELYYLDPSHLADASIKPEAAWAAETGADLIPSKDWMVSATVFARRERNVIDWIRSSTSEKWRTANIRRLRTIGAEVGVTRSFGPGAGISARYSRLSSQAGSIDYISKYVLDYARDSWSAAGFSPVPFGRLAWRQTVSFKRRADGRSYWIMDGRLERPFHLVVASIDFTNLLDSRYQEVSGIDMPGRWIMFTIRMR